MPASCGSRGHSVMPYFTDCFLAEAPEGVEAQDIDVALARVVATDVVVLLPFEAQPKRRHRIPLHAEAPRQAGVGVIAGNAEVRARFGLAVIEAELAVAREVGAEGQQADADEIPRGCLDGGLRAERVRGFYLAQVVIRELGGEMPVELVAAENAPRGGLVVARDAGAGDVLARILVIGRAEADPDVRGLRRRRQRESRRGDACRCDYGFLKHRGSPCG